MTKEKIKKILAFGLLGVCGYMLINAAAGIIGKQMVYPPQGVSAADFLQNTAEIYQKKAYAACGPDNWQKCIDNYNIAIKIGKADNISYFNRALAYSKLGKYNEAIADYTNALNLKKDAKAYICRGINYLRVNQAPAALADFDSAIVTDPAEVEAYLLRGAVNKRRNNFGGALSDYAKACTLGRNDACRELENGNILFCLFSDKYERGVSQHLALNLKDILGGQVAVAPSHGSGEIVLLVDLEYLGGRRRISESGRGAIKKWDTAAGLGMEGLFLNEMNFGRDGVSVWMPVQEMLFAGQLSALTQGEKTNLLAIHFRGGRDNTFLVIKNLPVDAKTGPPVTEVGWD